MLTTVCLLLSHPVHYLYDPHKICYQFMGKTLKHVSLPQHEKKKNKIAHVITISTHNEICNTIPL